ncbi:MAG: hypothetical protein R6V67_08920 [Spirochaetia bacterium]
MKKNIKAISLILIAVSMGALAMSCGLSSFSGVLFSTHQLTLNNGTDGTVSVGGEYYVGEKVTVTVNPDPDYVFYGWEGEGDAIDDFYAESSTKHSFSMPGEDIELTAQWLTIGDEGPAGGYIFYIDEANEFDWIGLEAAPEDIVVDGEETFQWGARGAEIGETDTVVGSGQANTTAIVDFIDSLHHTTTGESYYAFDWENLGGGVFPVGVYFTDGFNTYYFYEYNDGTVAAQECVELVLTHNGKTYDDWFLPSKDELNLMYVNLHDKGTGGFTEEDWYWSSSDTEGWDAWRQYFWNGDQSDDYKTYNLLVRAVRAFNQFSN